MTNDELKPCPFCGKSEAFLEKQEDDKDYIVICMNLRCLSKTGYYINPNEAIKAWNTRKESHEKA